MGASWVLVHEYVTGGGWPSAELPPGLAAEGEAMLAAVLADFRAWGGVRTLTLRDRRLAPRDLGADEVLEVRAGAHDATLDAALARCQAALFVAPETGGILQHLSARGLAAGVLLLGAHPGAIALAGDKWACYRQWQAAGVPTPLTRLARPEEAVGVAAEVGYPLVLKPTDGADCEGVCLATTPAELAPALEVTCRAAPHQPILLQPYLPGNHASASLLIAGDRVVPLSLNGQDIRAGRPFGYYGGCVPLAHRGRDQALAVAQAAAAAIPGLQGFAGVDLVLHGDRAWAVEINPRLTTAYVGLRRVVPLNLAQAIWQACIDGILPAPPALRGRAVFGRDRGSDLWEVG